MIILLLYCIIIKIKFYYVMNLIKFCGNFPQRKLKNDMHIFGFLFVVVPSRSMADVRIESIRSVQSFSRMPTIRHT